MPSLRPIEIRWSRETLHNLFDNHANDSITPEIASISSSSNLLESKSFISFISFLQLNLRTISPPCESEVI